MPEAALDLREASRDLETVLAYHRSSGLDPDRPGAMPERLDRRSQPIPFRRYDGAPRLMLPLVEEAQARLDAADEPDADEPGVEEPGVKKPGAALPVPDLEEVARLLQHSLALSGWKRWKNAGFGLRVVPSAGNLHPLEAYVLAPGLEEEAGGKGESLAALYHYSPFDHALERRRWLPAEVWQSLRDACPGASIFFALSAIYWRSAWKYGERAFRLTHLDAGHAVAALDAGAALGARRVCWVAAGQEALGRLLALGPPKLQDPELQDPEIQDPELEDAVALLALTPRSELPPATGWRPPEAALAALEREPLLGLPSRISERHRLWPGILSAARATRRPGAPTAALGTPVASLEPWAPEILRRRRSRSTFEDRALERRVFVQLLDPIFVASSFPCRRDLAVLLFVHRVDGLEPGLYGVFDEVPANDGKLGSSRATLSPELDWQELEVGGRGWRLGRLSAGDARRAATHLSGEQAAAGDGAFTVLFLGSFDALRRDGAWAYRRLHWTAGELGHRLYLSAEARHLGATGLGGFFDDRVLSLLGLGNTARAGGVPPREDWRPLYLLAVGHRCGRDPLLEPPYAHRGRGAEPAPASRGGLRLP